MSEPAKGDSPQRRRGHKVRNGFKFRRSASHASRKCSAGDFADQAMSAQQGELASKNCGALKPFFSIGSASAEEFLQIAVA